MNHMDTSSKDKNMIHKVLLNPVNSKDSFSFLALETVDFLHKVQWIIYRSLAVQFIVYFRRTDVQLYGAANLHPPINTKV